jgi:alanine dehydrogenase
MLVGVPREVKSHEYRVALTPAGVRELTGRGHEVLLECGAGVGAGLPDEEFVAAGARITADPDEVWGAAGLLLKVKEPVPHEYHRLRADQVLFAYLHLAASNECTDALVTAGATAVAYETVRLPDGTLPLLAPMSEVAGRMAPQVGAHHLQRTAGGRGVLLGGVPGVPAGKVAVIGAGVSGMNAATIALGLQAEVMVLDTNINRLRQIDFAYRGHLQTITSNAFEVERACTWADLVIGAVLVPGAKAPTLVSNDLVSRMRPGSVLVDPGRRAWSVGSGTSLRWPTWASPPQPRTRRSRPGSTWRRAAWSSPRSPLRTACPSSRSVMSSKICPGPGDRARHRLRTGATQGSMTIRADPAHMITYAA